MKFSASELDEIRRAFRQRVATAPTPTGAPPRTAKPVEKQQRAIALMRWPDYDDDTVLTLGEVAKVFAVSPRTIRRWSDAGMLPAFRTVGGWRRFRWGDIRRTL
jgi:excisionase family DNA binding protein